MRRRKSTEFQDSPILRGIGEEEGRNKEDRKGEARGIGRKPRECGGLKAKRRKHVWKEWVISSTNFYDESNTIIL